MPKHPYSNRLKPNQHLRKEEVAHKTIEDWGRESLFACSEVATTESLVNMKVVLWEAETSP